MEKYIIRVENLRRDFVVGGETVHALRGVSFSIREGEFVTIMGTSGSGKSTLLNLLGCLDTATAGEYYLDGISVREMSRNDRATLRNRKIGFVFQSYNLLPKTTALENVELAAQICPDSFDAEQTLCQVGLGERLANFPAQLSGGEQQRVAIARALALHPDILCFDEPTSALDPELTGEVLRVLRDLADRKTTMIIVTHEMAFARDVADQVIFMDGGVIVEQGEPRMVMDHPKEERTRQFLARYAQG